MSKFCGNCGTQLEDTAKVCGNCGTPLEQNDTAPDIPINFSGNKKSGKKKKIVISAVVIIAILIGIFSFSSSSNEPCDWCGDTPSKKYKVSEGHAYVCKDCSSECFFCGDKAKKHYENYLGTITFVCNDCYDEISNY